MKVLVLGSSGIIGQHMRLCVPSGMDPVWVRREMDCMHVGCDLTSAAAILDFLEMERPEVVVNLAGENSPDIVERDPQAVRSINVLAPQVIAGWCAEKGARFIQASTQAVFSGNEPPYVPDSLPHPVNAYGHQKLEAELAVRASGANWTIVRPTFVLGVRPLPNVGRKNPAEQILEGQPKQVADRYFSPLFACDAAMLLWSIIDQLPAGQVIHLGNPVRTSRHDIALRLGMQAEPVSHDSFPGIAPRPIDTTWAESLYVTDFQSGLDGLRKRWESRKAAGVLDRAQEIALFLGLQEHLCYARLSSGFTDAHQKVTNDFRMANPQSDYALLDWYRSTKEYIWELSAYHCDEGYNYDGMCKGIAERLKAAGARKVLCLGDGIGDLTMALKRYGFDPTYHDLAGSRTAAFAHFRFWRAGMSVDAKETDGWDARQIVNGRKYDAVVSLDFLEHVTDVPGWLKAIKEVMEPGGMFCAVNAFGMGSGPGGAMPMHLESNDRFERDWDPTLAADGWQQETSNWYRRQA